jgi:hypothetical protein
VHVNLYTSNVRQKKLYLGNEVNGLWRSRSRDFRHLEIRWIFGKWQILQIQETAP